MNETGRVADDIVIFPEYLVYNLTRHTNVLWYIPAERKLTSYDMEVMGGEVITELGDFFKPCSPGNGGAIGKEFYCVKRGFGMGYLFKVSPIYHSAGKRDRCFYRTQPLTAYV
jgi:hypothetical protein